MLELMLLECNWVMGNRQICTFRARFRN